MPEQLQKTYINADVFTRNPTGTALELNTDFRGEKMTPNRTVPKEHKTQWDNVKDGIAETA
jgi:hypothetical protein